MKVLLLNLPNRYGDKKRSEAFFPIGLGYIAAALKSAGHQVTVLDIFLLDMSDEEVVKYLSQADFDAVGISAMSTQYNYVKWLSKELKVLHKDRKIILGWVLATYSADIVLKNTDVDFCVIGEGEDTIVELLASLDAPSSVKGIAYLDNGVVRRTAPRPYIADLNSIPAIPYELFEVGRYIDSLAPIGLFKGERMFNVSCGRGCPYQCTFCSKSFSGVRLRSIDRVIEEIRYLKENWNIERVFFVDELLVMSKSRILELCSKIAPLGLKWNCQGRLNLMDQEILDAMRNSGCTAVGYGVESGSQRILDAMRKQTDVKKSVEIIRMTKASGLTPLLQAIFGYPGEDMASIKETLRFFEDIDVPFMEFTPITPLPGTELWQYCLDKGIIADETAFLEKLAGGYNADSDTLVNFTEFSDEELAGLKRWIERSIRIKYMLRHPLYALRGIFRKLVEIGPVGVAKKVAAYYK